MGGLAGSARVTMPWADAFAGRRVLVTGHTGFKGGWLSLWLAELGAEVTGYSLPPITTPNLFTAARVGSRVDHVEGDVRDLAAFRRVWAAARPDVVFHLAAQPLVRESYRDPLETIDNQRDRHDARARARSRGDVAARARVHHQRQVLRERRVAVRVSGRRSAWRRRRLQREQSRGGIRSSQLSAQFLQRCGRAGGGERPRRQRHRRRRLVRGPTRARLHPRADDGETMRVRNPEAVRPWQHVLEPLSGYLAVGAIDCCTAMLAGIAARSAWNFGPTVANTRTVGALVDAVVRAWGAGAWEQPPADGGGHEATLLRLAIDKAQMQLGWSPRWDFDEAIAANRRVVSILLWRRGHGGVLPRSDCAVHGEPGR